VGTVEADPARHRRGLVQKRHEVVGGDHRGGVVEELVLGPDIHHADTQRVGHRLRRLAGHRRTLEGEHALGEGLPCTLGVDDGLERVEAPRVSPQRRQGLQYGRGEQAAEVEEDDARTPSGPLPGYLFGNRLDPLVRNRKEHELHT